MKYFIHTIVVALLVSITMNIYLIQRSDRSEIEMKAFCAGFKNQASNRINTYYNNGDVVGKLPNEIFYSKTAESCVAIWNSFDFQPEGNAERKIIFDAITNIEYFSTTLYIPRDASADSIERYQTNKDEYDTKLQKLKGWDGAD